MRQPVGVGDDERFDTETASEGTAAEARNMTAAYEIMVTTKAMVNMMVSGCCSDRIANPEYFSAKL